MTIQLERIIQPIDLSHLDAPFTREETDNVINDFTTDKSPEPDGFNGKFLEK
jgi:hypothetical protein